MISMVAAAADVDSPLFVDATDLLVPGNHIAEIASDSRAYRRSWGAELQDRDRRFLILGCLSGGVECYRKN
jgi:hypothetical protein